MAKSFHQFVNDVTTTLNGAITNVATSMTVTSATGYPTSGDFYCLIESEIVKVTAVSGAVFTIVRGQAGTTGAAHGDGVQISPIVTKDNLNGWLKENACTRLLTHGFEDWTQRHNFQENGNTVAAADFSGETVTDNGDFAMFMSPAPLSSISLKIAYVSAPSTPYQIQGRVRADFDTFGSTSPSLAGLCFQDSSNSNVFMVYHRAGQDIFCGEWDNDTPIVIATAEILKNSSRPEWWVRLTNDGVDMEGFVSADGVNWRSLGTRAVGTTMTPNRIGWFGAIRGDTGHDISLISWREY